MQTTIGDFAKSIGRSYSGVRQRILEQNISPVGSIKVTSRKYAYLYEQNQLLKIKFRRKNNCRVIQWGY